MSNKADLVGDGAHDEKAETETKTWIDMSELVEKQKYAENHGTCTDQQYQVAYLAQLAEHYHKKALEAGDKQNNWTHFLRAHALYNSCQMKCTDDQEKITYRMYTDAVEEDYMKSVQFSQEQIQRYRALETPKFCLNSLRNDLREKVKSISSIEVNYNINDLSAADNLAIEAEIIERVKELSKRSTEGMKDIFKDIIAGVETVVGQPPCSYDVVGCGSLAREEMTPYSDLEFFVIMEKVTPENIEYFKMLSILTYFVISNVGETNLHYMCIEELERVNFKDDGPSGLKIDGLAPKAGNIPTGNGLRGGRILIDSPENLVAMYEEEMLAPSQADKGINGNLSDLLATTCLIYTHRDVTSQRQELLYETYNRLKQRVDADVLKPGSEQLNSKVQLFLDDIRKHDFLPIPKDQWSGQITHKTKQAIYRYPTILLNDLKIIFQHQDVRSPWEVINKIESDGILTASISHNFRLLVAIAIYTRLAVYLHYNSQKEEISFLKQRSDEVLEDTIERYHMSQKWFISMASIIIPVKHALIENVDKINGVDEIKECLQNLKFVKNNGCIKALAYMYQGDFRGCLAELNSLIAMCKELPAAAMQKFLAESLDERYIAALVMYYGEILMRDGLYDKAKAVFEFLVNSTDEKLKKLLLTPLANCLYYQGNYTESLSMFQEVLQQIRSNPCGLTNSLTLRMEGGITNNIARVLTKLGRYDEALVSYAESKKLCEQTELVKKDDSTMGTLSFNMANLYQEMGNSQLAIITQKEALRIREKLYGRSSTHSHIASSHDCLGRSLLLDDPVSNKEEALDHLIKALNMRKKLYDDGSDKKAHIALAFSYEHLAEFNLMMNSPADATENLHQAIHMRESVLGTKHIDLALSYSMLGDAYDMMGTSDKAIEAYGKAVEALPDGDRDEKKSEKILGKYQRALSRLKD